MVTDHVKKLIEGYLTLTIWFMAHQEDKDILTEQFSAVLKEIGNVEDQLRMHGLSQLAIDVLFDYADKLFQTPIDQLSANAQLRICKIIFGNGACWDKTPPTPKQSLGERKN